MFTKWWQEMCSIAKHTFYSVRRARKFRLRDIRITRYAVYTRVKYTTTPRAIHLSSGNGWVEFWPEPMKFLVDILNHPTDCY